jgi:hypothetical protein
VRVSGSCAPARGLTTGEAAPNELKGVEYENIYLVEAKGGSVGSFSRRRDQVDDQPGLRAGCRKSVSPDEQGSLLRRKRLQAGVKDLSQCGSQLLSRKKRAHRKSWR